MKTVLVTTMVGNVVRKAPLAMLLLVLSFASTIHAADGVAKKSSKASEPKGGAGISGVAQGLKHLTAEEQQKADSQANAFSLVKVTNANTGQSEGGEVPRATGLPPMTPKEYAKMRKNARVVKKVFLNKIGLARLNAERAKKGKKPLVAGRDVHVAPLGKDMETSAPSGDDSSATELQAPASGATPSETGEEAPAPGAGLPAEADNSKLQYFPPIRNQGSLGSCAQWAGAYYNMTHELALVRGWDAKNGGDDYRITPMFTYNFVNGGLNQGSHSWWTWDIAKVHGIPRWSEFYTTNYKTWCTTPAYYRSCLSERVAGYSTLYDVDTSSGMEALKAHLANGHVAVYYTYINSWKYKTTNDDPSTTADDGYVGKSIAYKIEGNNGGHAMTVVGYNDDIWCDIDGDGIVDAGEKGAFRIANSWGTGWKEGGFCWVAYNAVVTPNTVDDWDGNRYGIFQYNRIWFVNPLSEVHVPKVVARVTINHNLRNQVYMKVGTGAVGDTSPSSTVTPEILTYQAGAYAFSGTAATSEDFTYYLDFTDIVPSFGTEKRWFVQATDSGSNDGNLTIKNFELYYVDSGPDRLVGTAANLPQVANGNTKYAWLDWKMGDCKPFVTVIASDANAAEEGQNPGTWTITRDGDTSQSLTVHYSLSGSATAGVDYAVPSTTSVTIPKNAASVTVTITPVDDLIFGELFETAVLTITADASYLVQSDPATITIMDNDNHAPTAEAGEYLPVKLVEGAGGGDPVAGAYYKWDAAQDADGNNAWPSSTANPYTWTFAGGDLSPVGISDARFGKLTHAYAFPAAKSLSQTTLEKSVVETSSATWEFVLDTDADDGLIMESGGTTDGFQFWIAGGVLNGQVRDSGQNSTVSYTLTSEDKARFIHVVYVVDVAANLFKLYVDGVEVHSVSWSGGDWCGSDNAGFGCVGGAAPAGNVADFTGKIALVRFYESKAFNPSEVSTNFSSLSIGTAATVDLDGTVDDIDGDPLTTTWTVVSTDPVGLSVTFGDASAVDTTATFTVAGTYTLRLTADDSLAQGFDETVIIVNDPDNTPPTVDAGSYQPVTLTQGTGGGDPVAGAYFEWDAAQDTDGDAVWPSATPNTYDWTFDGGNLSPESVSDARLNRLTHAYAFPAAKIGNSGSFDSCGSAEPATFEFVIDVDGSDGSIFETGASVDGMQVDIVNGVLRGTVEEDPAEARVTYQLTAEDMGRFIHVVFVADNVNDVVQLYVDGELKDSQPWTAGEDWSGTGAASLGSTDGGTPDGGSIADFNGKMALFRFYKNKAFTAAEVTTNFNALSNGSSATVNLDGTVDDPDGTTPTTTWSLVSTDPTGLSIEFGDASAVDTTATFTEPGTYVLRLTADDGANIVSDEVTITVLAPEPEISVSGNSTEIGSGDTTPDPADHTDFGAVDIGSTLTRTFTIANTGAGDLTLDGTPLVDVDNGVFTVTVDPMTPVIPAADTTFQITFAPTTSGQQTATVTIANNDTDENPYTFTITGNGTATASPIADLALRNGLTIIGYTGENPINAEVAFAELITAGQLVNVRWIDPLNGYTKELYESPVFGWVNDIGDLALGEGYIVRTNAQCTLSISGNKSTASVTHDLRTLSIIGFNKETSMDAEAAFAELISAGKLLNVRWVDAAGYTQELYESPVFGWVNDIGGLVEGQGYIIKLNSEHNGFALP